MALVQLATNTLPHIDQRGLAARETVELESEDDRPIGWNKELTYLIRRDVGEVVNKMSLSIKVGAAPEGYRWKRCWPLLFVKKFALQIGPQNIWTTNSEILQIKYLIDGLQVHNDWQTNLPNVPLEMIQTPPECLFDFGEEERTRLSARPCEVLFEPLNLMEVSTMEYKIPLISFPFYEARARLVTSSLEECLEPIGAERPPLLRNVDSLLLKCKVSAVYLALANEERRRVMRAEYSSAIKRLIHCANVFEKPANRNSLDVCVNASNYCSAAYIWITDESGNEIPTQVLENILILFNGITREEMTGFQSRVGVRQLLPHPTLPNTKSQNLYYISYYPGRLTSEGLEQGVHLGRIDNITLRFTLTPETPRRFKVNLVHRDGNILDVRNGMAGMRLPTHDIGIETREAIQQWVARIVNAPVHPRPEAAETPIPLPFGTVDERIDIPQDEPRCMITWTDFKEGEAVQQCLACKKVMNSDAIDTWMQQRPHTRKCIHCQGPYSTTTFRKGIAHLTFERGGGEPEPQAQAIPLQIPESLSNQRVLNFMSRLLTSGWGAIYSN